MSVVSLSIDDRGVANLRLTRPEKHNAMSAQMIEELDHAARQLANGSRARVVVLSGEGPSFCAGGDLGWMRAQMKADRATRKSEALKLAEMLNRLNRLPQPVIGRVHGNAFGGGVGLISVCDVAYATRTPLFGLTETRLGLIPATIGPYVVARIGEANARRFFMSAQRFDASTAESVGLLAGVAGSVEALDALIESDVQAYLKCAPKAVAEAKMLALALGRAAKPEDIDASINALVARWEDDEAAEGIAAFFEKRAPNWDNSP